MKAELLFGAEKSSKRELVHQKLQVFFSRAALEKEGRPIGPNDMLIAAIALANGLTVVTHNAAELGRVPGLLIEDWEV